MWVRRSRLALAHGQSLFEGAEAVNNVPNLEATAKPGGGRRSPSNVQIRVCETGRYAEKVCGCGEMVFGSTPALKSTISFVIVDTPGSSTLCLLVFGDDGNRPSSHFVRASIPSMQTGSPEWMTSHRVGQQGALTPGALPIAKQPVVAQAVSRNKADGFSWGLE
ncbi:predicted protein [Chaetomium globosum CBS 148.51]|uniref:Uncharacterized protein n=1 Tax=Chaetomium globosum (strain ATCC 6205 / CBS 148.51 / DSM 1962 / NBRC 6347 / NRRL 1970) TaxID=306901 RepID=Q2GY23_CHAGB|nr:uncharacterized protein CHGG_07131 [Chaetomium globosum CBS 148.51]EAQ85878.1 predicted protein [Chaetomium globosum CBS 148.51]